MSEVLRTFVSERLQIPNVTWRSLPYATYPRWTAETVRQDASESLFQRFQSLRRRSPFTDSGTFRGVCPVSPMVRGDIAESFGKKLELGENDAVWRLSTRRHSLFIIMSLSSLTTLLCLWDQRINLSCRSGIQTRQNVFEPLAKADAVRFACCGE